MGKHTDGTSILELSPPMFELLCIVNIFQLTQEKQEKPLAKIQTFHSFSFMSMHEMAKSQSYNVHIHKQGPKSPNSSFSTLC